MSYFSDTSREAEEVHLAHLRKMSPHDRLRQTCVLSSQLRRMAVDSIRRRYPDMEEADVKLKFIELTYGKTLADAIREKHQEYLR